jgi:hypothetical protein
MADVVVKRTWPQFRALVNKMLVVEQGKMGITGFGALTLNDLADVDFWDWYPGDNEALTEEEWRTAASEAALHVIEEQDGFSFLMD